jgi:hypothetical protein
MTSPFDDTSLALEAVVERPPSALVDERIRRRSPTIPFHWKGGRGEVIEQDSLQGNTLRHLGIFPGNLLGEGKSA